MARHLTSDCLLKCHESRGKRKHTSPLRKVNRVHLKGRKNLGCWALQSSQHLEKVHAEKAGTGTELVSTLGHFSRRISLVRRGKKITDKLKPFNPTTLTKSY